MRPKRWIRRKVVFDFADGAAGAALVQSEFLALEGEILNIHQINGVNTGAKTAQLTLEDVDGIKIFDGTSKAHDAEYDFEFGVTIRRILSGNNILKCTISGDPGAGGYTVTAIISFVGRNG